MNNENNDLTNIFPSQGSDGNAVGNNMDNTNAINSNVESITNENLTNEQPIDLMGPLATEINNTVQENPAPQDSVMEVPSDMPSQPVDNMVQPMEAPSGMPSQPVDNMAQPMEAPSGMPSQPVDNMAQPMGVPSGMPSQPVDNTMPNMGAQVPPVMNQNVNMNPIPPMGNTMNQGNKGGFMGKYGKIIFIVLALVVVGAALYMIFGGKKLTCTQKEDSMEASITFKFASDKAKSAHVQMSITLPDEYKNQKDTFISAIEEEYKSSEYKDANAKVTSKGNTIIVTMDINDKNFSILDLEDSKNNTYDKIKKDMESAGYTCK